MQHALQQFQAITQHFDAHQKTLIKLAQQIATQNNHKQKIKQICSNTLMQSVKELQMNFGEFAQTLKSEMPIIFQELSKILGKIVELYEQKLWQERNKAMELEMNYEKILEQVKQSNKNCQPAIHGRKYNTFQYKQQNSDKNMNSKRRNSLMHTKSKNSTLSTFSLSNTQGRSSFQPSKRLSFDPKLLPQQKEPKIEKFRPYSISSPQQKDFNPNDLTIFKQHITELFYEEDMEQNSFEEEQLPNNRSKTMSDILRQSVEEEEQIRDSRNEFLNGLKEWSKSENRKIDKINKFSIIKKTEKMDQKKGENKMNKNQSKQNCNKKDIKKVTEKEKQGNFMDFKKKLYRHKN